MTDTIDTRPRFVANLRRLAREQDRGALADLRSDLRGQPADRFRAGKYVVPYLGEHATQNDAWFYLVGGLFATHPQDDPEMGNFGESLRRLQTKNGSDSLDQRLLALLDAPAEDVARHLRGLVGQLEQHGIPVNWLGLLKDLCYWRSPDKAVQRAWARAYYHRSEPTAQSADPSDEGDQHEG